MIYDYLFRFDDEEQARTLLTAWYQPEQSEFVGEETITVPAQWKSGVLPVTIVALEATFDEEGDLIEPQADVPGWWLVISTSELSEEFASMDVCVQCTERPETPTPVSQTIEWTKLTADQYQNFKRVTPVFAGAAYLWGE